MLTEQMKVALMRSAAQAFIQFGGLFFATIMTTNDVRAALIAGGFGAFVALGFRGVGEGTYDSNRNVNGHVQSSDVTPMPAGSPPPDDSLYADDLNDPSLGINRK